MISDEIFLILQIRFWSKSRTQIPGFMKKYRWLIGPEIVICQSPRILLTLFLFFTLSLPLTAQSPETELIGKSVPQKDVEFNIRFLAADEFRGRDTGTPELKIAGRYIATWFKTNGINPAPGHEQYYQPVPLKRLFTPDEGTITLGDSTYSYPDDFIALSEPRGEFKGSIVVLNYGTESEIEEADLEGKIVITKAGTDGQSNPQQWYRNTSEKNKRLKEAGAEAVIELYDNRQMPWGLITNYLNREQLILDDQQEDSGNLMHIWLNSTGESLHATFEDMESDSAKIEIRGKENESVISNNVVGYIEGTDSDLKHEHILLSAHYDHLGVSPGPEEGNYVYNGARDNAAGTSAILLAARHLANHPPARSILIAAWTAEEKGLLGSAYFANNPMIPLDQIVYNLNIDGAGYNDTTKVTVIGLNRTTADDELKESARAFDLEAISDPAPEQNLFNRSDNVHFARHGIPAPTYSLGFTSFDDEINQHYHQVSDEAGTINYSYVTKYTKAYIYAVEAIANREETPFWIPGDTYEEAGKELYGID